MEIKYHPEDKTLVVKYDALEIVYSVAMLVWFIRENPQNEQADRWLIQAIVDCQTLQNCTFVEPVYKWQ